MDGVNPVGKMKDLTIVRMRHSAMDENAKIGNTLGNHNEWPKWYMGSEFRRAVDSIITSI